MPNNVRSHRLGHSALIDCAANHASGCGTDDPGDVIVSDFTANCDPQRYGYTEHQERNEMDRPGRHGTEPSL